ncbi:MAG TPA: CoA-acylating methylmalonate-semialdehyde dehydrogenase [Abditibacterium sp.]|jgi:malonate-semialdehyde dehydrogenase (acetylating)/methylmalonate-semialdehyde dehydrogenase
MTTAQNFIGGQWISPPVAAFGDVFNPSQGQIIAQVPMSGAAEVDAAVSAARAAFESWGQTPASKRATILFRYREVLEANFEAIAKIVTLENGKTWEEAKGDVRRGIEVVELACGIGQLAKGESLPQVADGIDAATMREPIGVCAGITPFNFPAMVPMWMFPLAIACGNTFILKPSEKVPLTAIKLAELFQEAGLPDGVLNLVHGGREVVDALCTHKGISAVSFVGSSGVAKHVYTLGTSHGKRVQAAGGAKNVLLVMPDADIDSSLRAVLGSAYGCAGQRCMAGSILMTVGQKTGDQWRDLVSDSLSKMTLGDTGENRAADMGPVIDAGAQSRIRKVVETASGHGAEVAFQGRNTPESGFFVAPTLLDHVAPTMDAFASEIFGPVLSLVRPDSLDEAIATMNGLAFGNGATIFTSSGGAARQFAREMQCGMIGVNIGVPAPMALFSFSGWNDSFYGDLHVQGNEGVMFYTRQKVVLSRWDKSYVRQMGW